MEEDIDDFQINKRKKWIQSLSVLSSDDEDLDDKNMEPAIPGSFITGQIAALRFPYPMVSDDSEDDDDDDEECFQYYFKKTNPCRRVSKKIKHNYSSDGNIDLNKENEIFKDKKRKLSPLLFSNSDLTSRNKKSLKNNTSCLNNNNDEKQSKSKNLKGLILSPPILKKSSTLNTSSSRKKSLKVLDLETYECVVTENTSKKSRSSLHNNKSKNSNEKKKEVKKEMLPKIKSNSGAVLNIDSKNVGNKTECNFLAVAATSSRFLDSSAEEEDKVVILKPKFKDKSKFRRINFFATSSSDSESEKSTFNSKEVCQSPVFSVDSRPSSPTTTRKRCNRSKFLSSSSSEESTHSNCLLSKQDYICEPKTADANFQREQNCEEKTKSGTEQSTTANNSAWTDIAHARLKKSSNAPIFHKSIVENLRKRLVASNLPSVEVRKQVYKSKKARDEKCFVSSLAKSSKMAGQNKVSHRPSKGKLNLHDRNMCDKSYDRSAVNHSGANKMSKDNFTVNVNVYCSPVHTENSEKDPNTDSNDRYPRSAEIENDLVQSNFDINLSVVHNKDTFMQDEKITNKLRVAHSDKRRQSGDKKTKNQDNLQPRFQGYKTKNHVTKQRRRTKEDESFPVSEERNNNGYDVLGNILSEMDNNPYKRQASVSQNLVQLGVPVTEKITSNPETPVAILHNQDLSFGSSSTILDRRNLMLKQTSQVENNIHFFSGFPSSSRTQAANPTFNPSLFPQIEDSKESSVRGNQHSKYVYGTHLHNSKIERGISKQYSLSNKQQNIAKPMLNCTSETNLHVLNEGSSIQEDGQNRFVSNTHLHDSNIERRIVKQYSVHSMQQNQPTKLLFKSIAEPIISSKKSSDIIKPFYSVNSSDYVESTEEILPQSSEILLGVGINKDSNQSEYTHDKFNVETNKVNSAMISEPRIDEVNETDIHRENMQNRNKDYIISDSNNREQLAPGPLLGTSSNHIKKHQEEKQETDKKADSQNKGVRIRLGGKEFRVQSTEEKDTLFHSKKENTGISVLQAFQNVFIPNVESSNKFTSTEPVIDAEKNIDDESRLQQTKHTDENIFQTNNLQPNNYSDSSSSSQDSPSSSSSDESSSDEDCSDANSVKPTSECNVESQNGKTYSIYSQYNLTKINSDNKNNQNTSSEQDSKKINSDISDGDNDVIIISGSSDSEALEEVDENKLKSSRPEISDATTEHKVLTSLHHEQSLSENHSNSVEENTGFIGKIRVKSFLELGVKNINAPPENALHMPTKDTIPTEKVLNIVMIGEKQRQKNNTDVNQFDETKITVFGSASKNEKCEETNQSGEKILNQHSNVPLKKTSLPNNIKPVVETSFKIIQGSSEPFSQKNNEMEIEVLETVTKNVDGKQTKQDGKTNLNKVSHSNEELKETSLLKNTKPPVKLNLPFQIIQGSNEMNNPVCAQSVLIEPNSNHQLTINTSKRANPGDIVLKSNQTVQLISLSKTQEQSLSLRTPNVPKPVRFIGLAVLQSVHTPDFQIATSESLSTPVLNQQTLIARASVEAAIDRQTSIPESSSTLVINQQAVIAEASKEAANDQQGSIPELSSTPVINQHAVIAKASTEAGKDQQMSISRSGNISKIKNHAQNCSSKSSSNLVEPQNQNPITELVRENPNNLESNTEPNTHLQFVLSSIGSNISQSNSNTLIGTGTDPITDGPTCSNNKESVFFKLCDEFFSETLGFKLPKLADDLHLLITYDSMKEERLKKAAQLICPETREAEKRRAEKDFSDMVKIRGQQFVPLFLSIVNKIDKKNFKTFVIALYCRLVKILESINPSNLKYRFRLRQLIKSMLLKHNLPLTPEISAVFDDSLASFIKNFDFVNKLLLDYDKFVEQRQQDIVMNLNPEKFVSSASEIPDNCGNKVSYVAFTSSEQSSPQIANDGIGPSSNISSQNISVEIGNLDQMILGSFIKNITNKSTESGEKPT